MSDVRCHSCRFFTQADVMGLCRRFPQTQNKHGMDWCGEHYPAAATTLPVVDAMQPKKRGRKPKNA